MSFYSIQTQRRSNSSAAPRQSVIIGCIRAGWIWLSQPARIPGPELIGRPSAGRCRDPARSRSAVEQAALVALNNSIQRLSPAAVIKISNDPRKKDALRIGPAWRHLAAPAKERSRSHRSLKTLVSSAAPPMEEHDRSVHCRSAFALFASARRQAGTCSPPGGRTNKIAAGRAHFRDAVAAGGAEHSQPDRVCCRDHL